MEKIPQENISKHSEENDINGESLLPEELSVREGNQTISMKNTISSGQPLRKHTMSFSSKKNSNSYQINNTNFLSAHFAKNPLEDLSSTNYE